MASTVTQDGITYVERDYKCLDCDWTWTQVCVKGDGGDVPKCPNCANVDRHRFSRPNKGEEIKSCTGKRKPKKHEVDWANPKFHIKTARQRSIAKAANMAFEEAQKQGFTDLVDHGLREGDVCAPKLTSLPAMVQDRMFGGGWTGGGAPQYTGSATNAGGAAAMGALQKGVINGQIADRYGTPLLKNK